MGLEALPVNANGATVLGTIPVPSDTVESEGWKMEQRRIKYISIGLTGSTYTERTNYKKRFGGHMPLFFTFIFLSDDTLQDITAQNCFI
jgi:hypothetical protein